MMHWINIECAPTIFTRVLDAMKRGKAVLIFIAIILALSCCVPRSDNKKAREGKAEHYRDSINLAIDSTVRILDLAISEIERGQAHAYVTNVYQPKIGLMRSKINMFMDSISSEFIARGRSKDDYNKFMSEIRFELLPPKMDSLRKEGLDFKLK